MSKTKFSADLFEQLGGTHWQAKPGALSSQMERGQAAEVMSEQAERLGFSQVSLQDQVEQNSIARQNAEAHESTPVLSDVMRPNVGTYSPEQVVADVVEDVSSRDEAVVQNSVVLVGQDLERFWQNDESIEWQLWQNIMQVFGWDETLVQFYDTTLIVSEDMVFNTIEEIIDSGSEWVLTMGDEHPLTEQLSEGLQVISVPSFEDMFADPFAKKTFYQTVLALSPELDY